MSDFEIASFGEAPLIYRRRELRQNKRSYAVTLFNIESIFALFCLAATLLLLPLLLPPLPPPPLILLLLPIAILLVLMLLAFMPGYAPNIVVPSVCH